MASLTITVSDAQVPRIVAAFRAGFQTIDQGLADGAFLRAAIAQWATSVVRNYEQAVAAQAAAGGVTDISAS